MSSYWSAISGTTLILDPDEAEEFFRKYLLEGAIEKLADAFSRLQSCS